MLEKRSLPQLVALTFGVIYLAVGILGFLPLLGGSYTQTPSNLLGLVPINLLHNLVHLLIGVAGVAGAATLAASRLYLRVFGIVLLALGVLGLVVSNPVGLVPIGGFDIVIHIVTGGILAYFGFVQEPAPVRAA